MNLYTITVYKRYAYAEVNEHQDRGLAKSIEHISMESNKDFGLYLQPNY